MKNSSAKMILLLCWIASAAVSAQDFIPVPLDAYASVPRSDVSGKPGWIRQGPGHDIRGFHGGKQRFCGIPFLVPEKCAVMLAGATRKLAPVNFRMKLPETKGMRFLVLLHTSAWTPEKELGKLVFHYRDGKSESVSVQGGRDCGNWISPNAGSNSAVVWRSVTASDGSATGVYASVFPLSRPDPAELSMQCTSPGSVWVLLGVSFARNMPDLPFIQTKRREIREGEDWVKCSFSGRIPAGNILDFSELLDAPAGKYGRAVPTPDGTFRFAENPKRRLKLFGTNLCRDMNFPDHARAEELAEELARTGYNAVRFHHHDGLLTFRSAKPDELDPENLDRLDFLFAALKKRGIYCVTDFYCSRPFKQSDGIPGFGASPKSLLILQPEARENWKRFVRAWMTHVNPYTGIAWGRDPALVLANLVNEDNALSVWKRSPADRKLWRDAFEKWKHSNGRPNAEVSPQDPDFVRFLREKQTASLAEMIRFVKEELGLQIPLVSLNFHKQQFLTGMRDVFDLVDNHTYHAHPDSTTGKQIRTYDRGSSISVFARVPREIFAMRIFGKPHVVTEFNFCKPNTYRSEGGPLIGGYAALQDWDGLFRFCYSHRIERFLKQAPALNNFETVSEPLQQLGERIIWALFLRGDASPAPRGYSLAVNPDKNAYFPARFQMLGLVARIGSHPESRKPAGNAVLVQQGTDFGEAETDAALWKRAVRENIACSSTGELHLDRKKECFTIRTPRTESVSLAKGSLSTGGVLAVAGAKRFQTVAAISRDGRPLAESSRILLLHLTDFANDGAVLQENGGKIQALANGNLPYLMRRDRCEIELGLNGSDPVIVTAYSADGRKLGIVPSVRKKGKLTFSADTGSFPGGVPVYAISRTNVTPVSP